MSENGAGYEDLGFAKLDTNREQRTGFPEVVFCEDKPDAYLPEIFQRLVAADGRALGTRASERQAGLVREVLPQATYDPVSRILSVAPEVPVPQVAVVCAGTADTPVAEEASRVAEFFGTRVTRHYDVGVAGLHRLLDQMDHADGIRAANCVVAVAGMEGALASVVGGLVSVPVIAVPTSVGYGASFNGMAALLSMLNSCANGVATVNIDNGFGAAYLATQINRLAVGGSAS